MNKLNYYKLILINFNQLNYYKLNNNKSKNITILILIINIYKNIII